MTTEQLIEFADSLKEICSENQELKEQIQFYIKERQKIKNLLKEGKIEQAINYLKY